MEKFEHRNSNISLSEEIKESIRCHCYSNSLQDTMKKEKNKTINYTHRSDDYRDIEFLLFNHTSRYLQTRFPNVFLDKNNEEKQEIIFKWIEEFLKQWERADMTPFIINKLRKYNQNLEKESTPKKVIKNKVREKITSLFM